MTQYVLHVAVALASPVSQLIHNVGRHNSVVVLFMGICYKHICCFFNSGRFLRRVERVFIYL